MHKRVKAAIQLILNGRLHAFEHEVAALAAYDLNDFLESLSDVSARMSDPDSKWAADVVRGFVNRYRAGLF